MSSEVHLIALILTSAANRGKQKKSREKLHSVSTHWEPAPYFSNWLQFWSWYQKHVSKVLGRMWKLQVEYLLIDYVNRQQVRNSIPEKPVFQYIEGMLHAQSGKCGSVPPLLNAFRLLLVSKYMKILICNIYISSVFCFHLNMGCQCFIFENSWSTCNPDSSNTLNCCSQHIKVALRH